MEGRVLRRELRRSLQPGERIGILVLAQQRQAQVSVRLGEIRGEADRLEISGLGFDESPQLAIRIAQVMMQGRDVGLQTNRRLAVRQRLVRLAPFQQHLAQVRPGVSIVRSDLDRSTKMVQGQIELAQLAERIPEVAVHGREIGTQRQGPAELLDGLGEPPHSLKRQSQVAHCFRIVRLQAQCRPATARGPVKLPQLPEGLSQIGVINRDVGPECHRSADQRDGPRIVPLLVMEHTEKVQRIGVRGILGQDLLVNLGGLTQLARLVKRDGGPQKILHDGDFPPFIAQFQCHLDWLDYKRFSVTVASKPGQMWPRPTVTRLRKRGTPADAAGRCIAAPLACASGWYGTAARGLKNAGWPFFARFLCCRLGFALVSRT